MASNRTVIKWTKDITPALVEQLIRSEKDIKKAILVFDTATAEYSNGFCHDHTTFGTMISKLVSANQFRSAESLLVRMKEENCEIKEYIFLFIIRGFGRVHKPFDAIRVFHKMEEFDCKPTPVSYISLLSILVDEYKFKEAFGFYKYMKEMGVPKCLASLNILLKALCRKSNTLDSAINMFRDMPRHHFTPDSYTYGTLISGLCRFDKVKDAKKLFREMEAKGCTPSVVTYTILIHGLCRLNNLDEAVSLFEEMKHKEIAPNAFTYSALMHGFCKSRQSLYAMKLFNLMIREGHTPNMVTYTILLYGLCKEGKLREALEFFDRMKLQGLKSDAVLHGKIILALCDTGKFEQAANRLDEMVFEGVRPNRVTWNLHVRIHNTVIQGLCDINDNLNRGFLMCLRLRKIGVNVDHATYNSLLKCSCKKGDSHKVARILDEMFIDGCVPDERTWRFLVDAFCGRTEVHEAAKILMDKLKL